VTTNNYPQYPEEWRSAIYAGIGLNEKDGQKIYRAGKFPYKKLEGWIRETFCEGYSPDFIPALVRNIKGLVAWIYGDVSEPYWPGSDHDNPTIDSFSSRKKPSQD